MLHVMACCLAYLTRMFYVGICCMLDSVPHVACIFPDCLAVFVLGSTRSYGGSHSDSTPERMRR
jgi:hypothetical protein